MSRHDYGENEVETRQKWCESIYLVMTVAPHLLWVHTPVNDHVELHIWGMLWIAGASAIVIHFWSEGRVMFISKIYAGCCYNGYGRWDFFLMNFLFLMRDWTDAWDNGSDKVSVVWMYTSVSWKCLKEFWGHDFLYKFCICLSFGHFLFFFASGRFGCFESLKRTCENLDWLRLNSDVSRHLPWWVFVWFSI